MIKNKTILVTGSSGFIGTHLVNALKKYNKIYTMPSYGNVYNIDFKELDMVFHLGAKSIVSTANINLIDTFEYNIKGTWELLENCRKGNVPKIIVASTDKVYGEGLGRCETDNLGGVNPYEISKVCVDKLSQCYMDFYGMNIIITRSANVYGPGDHNLSRLVPRTIHNIQNNESPVIKGDGRTTRNFIYIKDVISAYLHVAEKCEKGIYNFGTNDIFSVKQIIDKIATLMNKKIEYKFEPLKNEIFHQSVDWAKLKKTGWHPKYDINLGLSETVKLWK